MRDTQIFLVLSWGNAKKRGKWMHIWMCFWGNMFLNEYQKRQRRDHLDIFEVFEKQPFFVIVNLVHVSFFGLIAIRFLLLRIAKCRVALSFCQFRKFAPSKSNRSPLKTDGLKMKCPFMGW